jgi:hypothetical protein
MDESGKVKVQEMEERRAWNRRQGDDCPFKDLRDSINSIAGKAGAVNGKEEPKFSQFQQWLITILIAGVITIFVWWSNNVNDADKRQLEKLTAIELQLSNFITESRGRMTILESEMRRAGEDLKDHIRTAPYNNPPIIGPSPRR